MSDSCQITTTNRDHQRATFPSPWLEASRETTHDEDRPPRNRTVGGISFHRVYNPDTMRGTVAGSITGGGVGTWTWSGDLHGVLTADGMSGDFALTQTPDSSSNNVGEYRIVGTWESDGHPTAPSVDDASPTYCVTFDAVIIGPF